MGQEEWEGSDAMSQLEIVMEMLCALHTVLASPREQLD